MKMDKLPTNLDCIRVIAAHNEEYYATLIEFLKTFADQDRQSLICIFAELEFDYIRN